MTTAPGRPRVSVAVSGTPLCREFIRSVQAEGVIELDLREVKPIHRAFRPMVMETAFDISELAIVTAIQAIDHGKPIIPLPITVAARLQHKCIVQNVRFGTLEPADLPGRKVAVRAYSQTTGAWVRTLLEREYGIRSDSISWITQEAPHVAEAAEPSNVLRDPDGAGPAELLASGRVDAAIFGNDLPADAWVRPLIADPDSVAQASYERSGIVPINHIVAVARDFALRQPELVRYVYRSFEQSRRRAFERAQERAFHPFGFEAMRPSVDALLQSAASQHLTSKQIRFDDLFGEAARLLGQTAAG
jgi:4,5-dihydroxyphthalate decarboxylase